MGKKLTLWEKRKRDEEKENEAELKRQKTVKRRELEKLNKDELTQAQLEKSKLIVEEYNLLYSNINNLHLISQDILKGKSIEKILFNPLTIQPLPDLEKTKLKLIKPDYTSRSFVNNPYIKKLKENGSITFNEYTNRYNKTYIPFLDFLFGVKKKYNSFLVNSKSELNKVLSLEQKRKKDYDEVLEAYNEIIKKVNEEKINKNSTLNIRIEKKYNILIDEIKISNNERKQILTIIFKEFLELKPFVVYEVLLKLLPLDFKLGQKYLISNPSKYPVGLGEIENKSINFYINIPENSFPLESKSKVMLKNGHSEKSLTKLQIKEINENYIPSLMISYANVLFSLTSLIKINLFIVSNKIDPSTGREKLMIIDSRLIEKTIFDKLVLSKIKPSKAISNFEHIKLNDVIEDEKNYWSNRNYKRGFKYVEFIKNITLSSESVKSVKTQKKEIFVRRTPEIKNLEKKLKKISGMESLM